MLSNLTIITVNYRTPDLIRECVQSFKIFYPKIDYLVIDNGECKSSINWLRGLEDTGTIQLIENEQNIYHGPALHQGLRYIYTDYAFLLDSDTRTEKDGFLEEMLEQFERDNKLFALGWLRKVNDGGVQDKNGKINYIHPFACMLNVNIYRQLKPFANIGAPAINTMRDATRNGYALKDYPIANFIHHKVAGTRGYFAGKWKPKIGEGKREWTRYNL